MPSTERGPARPVTISDVARRAGVSPSTVSYAVSGKRSVSPSTRERIRRTIEELGYHPNAGARALAAQRSEVLALLVPMRPDSYLPVLMEIAVAVTTEARRYGYDVLLVTEEGGSALDRVSRSGRADAAILMDVELDDERLPRLRETGLPAVLIGRPAATAGLTCVDFDFRAAGAACVDHLAELGHRRLAFIGAPAHAYARRAGFAERTRAGFAERAAGLGLAHLARPCEGGYEAVAGTLARILEERPGTTGFAVHNEAAATPLLGLLRSTGRIVPEEASVVAVCSDQAAEQTAPALTAIPLPAAELGRQAVRLAMDQLSGAPAPEPLLLPPGLTRRDSSGPAPVR